MPVVLRVIFPNRNNKFHSVRTSSVAYKDLNYSATINLGSELTKVSIESVNVIKNISLKNCNYI